MNKIFLSFVILSAGAQCYAAIFKNGVEQNDLSHIHSELNTIFEGTCPKSIRVMLDGSSRTSYFNPSTDTIFIGKGHEKQQDFEGVITHESAHLCMASISRGATTKNSYRFLDEGFAKVLGDMKTTPYKQIKYKSIAVSSKLLHEGLVDFSNVKNWDRYFGSPSQPGTTGWAAYHVGASFYLYFSETYSQQKFILLLKEIGKSLTFSNALRDTIGKSEIEIEQEWINYIKATVFELKSQDSSEKLTPSRSAQ